jgi:hypothetical protein
MLANLAIARDPDFSIVGQWEDASTPTCAYHLSFTATGGIFVESGQERLEGSYTFTRLIGQRPIARVERIITRSNGKPDCDGRVLSYTQDPQPAYVFLETKSVILLCFDMKGETCFARLQRK